MLGAYGDKEKRVKVPAVKDGHAMCCIVWSCHERERSRGGVEDVALAWRSGRSMEMLACLARDPEKRQGCGWGGKVGVWTAADFHRETTLVALSARLSYKHAQASPSLVSFGGLGQAMAW